MGELFADFPEEWPLLVGAAVVLILIAEAVYLLFFTARSYRTNVNRRLAIQNQGNNREEVLLQLKRERGIDDRFGQGVLSGLVRLISQTGLTIPPNRIFLFWALFAIASPIVATVLEKTAPGEIAGAVIFGLVFPLFVLKYLRGARVKKFAEQFPEAIDVIVRSLRAGHPLQIAIALVAREMPDPVGTEFGIVTDEMTFGLDLETAMRNMYLRVGQEDLPLFVTSVSIQASTGGNLALVLDGLSRLIRDRFKMRRKIKALSSEAKFSAYVLIALPIIIYFGVQMGSPDYFAAAKGHDITTKVVIGSCVWMTIGVLFMRKLVNMKV
ncbi:MAG: type II secretion system F family protein [Beijerinckiaceae bacterium]